ncbi:hypothetical protein [Halonotius sp. GCM10025705]|uniref:hypothetical protein n=1 Tax=Halonotius sp. GCM10025705 TaxID=3252678 RepID=UPI0036204569
MESPRSTAQRYRVLSEMTTQDGMTVADPAAGTVLQVVSYQDDALHDRLAGVNVGSVVTIGLERAGTRANAYVAYRPPEGCTIRHNPPLQLETRAQRTDDPATTEISHPVLHHGSDDTTPPTV